MKLLWKSKIAFILIQSPTYHKSKVSRLQKKIMNLSFYNRSINITFVFLHSISYTSTFFSLRMHPYDAVSVGVTFIWRTWTNRFLTTKRSIVKNNLFCLCDEFLRFYIIKMKSWQFDRNGSAEAGDKDPRANYQSWTMQML